ncbi:MAG: hypothetical protein ACHQ2Z_16845, partial [Elusimicrobiota bacterium]
MRPRPKTLLALALSLAASSASAQTQVAPAEGMPATSGVVGAPIGSAVPAAPRLAGATFVTERADVGAAPAVVNP